ncbi:hypothetical protein [uncultured Draconibacterium sp.]|uniref:hypothetical protein n=1 Tax=uncultured Draconibacterium sp. TaxID=1573823 RepID=UPI0025E1403A|nr:hypothetical protein [uncultured Draconibacterium sp.]
MMYKVRELDHLILKPDPIIYGDRAYEICVNVIDESIEENPVQLASVYWLQKLRMWGKEVLNPLGYLMLLIYNQETSESLGFRMTEQDDMEKMVLHLSENSAGVTNQFLFPSNQGLEMEEMMEEKERVASEVLTAKNEDELRLVLIGDLLYHAMVNNIEDWPPQSIMI